MTHKSRGLFRQPFPMSTSRSAARLFVKISSHLCFYFKSKAVAVATLYWQGLEGLFSKKLRPLLEDLARGDPNQLEVYHRCFYDVITCNLFVLKFFLLQKEGFFFKSKQGSFFQGPRSVLKNLNIYTPGN